MHVASDKKGQNSEDFVLEKSHEILKVLELFLRMVPPLELPLSFVDFLYGYQSQDITETSSVAGKAEAY